MFFSKENRPKNKLKVKRSKKHRNLFRIEIKEEDNRRFPIHPNAGTGRAFAAEDEGESASSALPLIFFPFLYFADFLFESYYYKGAKAILSDSATLQLVRDVADLTKILIG